MRSYILSKKEIIPFLKKNGFKYIERNSYANEYCGICFTDEGITIADNDGEEYFVSDMFGMIGVLTYYGFINKNYKK